MYSKVHCTVRKGKYKRKKKLRSVSFKTEDNVPTAEFGMMSPETAFWARERK
jgi:hypothetical protein